jgi:hypothetical protein
MANLKELAKVNFYAGPPDEAHSDRLVWDGDDYAMEVIIQADGLVAVMSSGNCKWITSIDIDNIKNSIDHALEDACNLGRIANYSRDPERN